MYVFLDTEFIPKSSSSPVRLLSIGLCSERGHEFYRELALPPDALPAAEGNVFIRTKVLPQMGTRPQSVAEPAVIARDLAAWLDTLDASELEVCYDFHVDYDLFEELLTLIAPPAVATLCPTHVGYLNEDDELEVAVAACFASLELERGLHRHHALADAHALRAKFWAAHGR